MTAIDVKQDNSPSTTYSDLSSSPFSFSVDCSPFLNWTKGKNESESKKLVVVRSLVSTLKLQPALDDNLKAKAVNILQSVNPMYSESADAFLSGFGQTTKESSRNFVQSIVVVVSSVNLVIITAAMELLRRLIFCCSPKVRLALVKTDLIPQIIITLNPQSLFFTEAVDIHICLIQIIFHSLELATPYYFSRLGIVDGNEQQGVHETVLKHVVAPSEKYVCHLCVNRFSIIDGRLSETFLELLAHLLDRCPYYQRTSEFVLRLPVVLTISSSLPSINKDHSTWTFLIFMVTIQREWNSKDRELRRNWQTVHRMLRMKGFEDVIDEKLRNDRKEMRGRYVVVKSFEWSNMQGMNIPD
ncbi:hypothetical protein BLNAU_8448 [Blattamonas nauphoetae]|uniref:Uncharacterized protein n=1 Tax=Blattamonas nauphoetae TaxID=2049346 RepID=A0ABQ9XYR5_9EUKA|nr:hypothetical protein BLNAU_8448 [Blattamonas nauphoetae]